MWDLQLRRLVAAITSRVAKYLGRYFSANSLTCLSFVCGLAAAAFTADGWQKAGLLCWILNRVLDGLDGPVARAYGQQSDFGGYLDIVSDFVVYALLPVALQPACLPLLLAAYFVNCASLFRLSAVLECFETNEKSTSVEMPPALVEGAETIGAYTLALSMPAYSVGFRQNAILSAFAVAVAVSAAQRVRWACEHLTSYRA